jgi:hypothetical protein
LEGRTAPGWLDTTKGDAHVPNALVERVAREPHTLVERLVGSGSWWILGLGSQGRGSIMCGGGERAAVHLASIFSQKEKKQREEKVEDEEREEASPSRKPPRARGLCEYIERND